MTINILYIYLIKKILTIKYNVRRRGVRNFDLDTNVKKKEGGGGGERGVKPQNICMIKTRIQYMYIGGKYKINLYRLLKGDPMASISGQLSGSAVEFFFL